MCPSDSTDLRQIELYLEIIGISKSFGHPCLSIREGLEQIRKYGTGIGKYNKGQRIEVVGMFKKKFCMSYIKRHNKWPAHEPLMSNNPIIEMTSRYWKSLNTIICYDTTELLKDTAIAPPLLEWSTQYDPCAYQILYGKQKPKIRSNPEAKRVILCCMHQKKSKIVVRTAMLNELKATFESVSLELKHSETWYSQRLYEYGKNRYLNGKAVISTTKKSHD